MEKNEEKKKSDLNQLCRYCDPPVPHEQCPGHSINPTKVNRFMQDKSFVDGSRIEIE